jgi:hypothetical protein
VCFWARDGNAGVLADDNTVFYFVTMCVSARGAGGARDGRRQYGVLFCESVFLRRVFE